MHNDNVLLGEIERRRLGVLYVSWLECGGVVKQVAVKTGRPHHAAAAAWLTSLLGLGALGGGVSSASPRRHLAQNTCLRPDIVLCPRLPHAHEHLIAFDTTFSLA